MNQQDKPDPMDRAPEPFEPISITQEEIDTINRHVATRTAIKEALELAVSICKDQIIQIHKSEREFWDALLKKYNVETKTRYGFAYDPAKRAIVEITESDPFSN